MCVIPRVKYLRIGWVGQLHSEFVLHRCYACKLVSSIRRYGFYPRQRCFSETLLLMSSMFILISQYWAKVDLWKHIVRAVIQHPREVIAKVGFKNRNSIVFFVKCLIGLGNAMPQYCSSLEVYCLIIFTKQLGTSVIIIIHEKKKCNLGFE